MHQFLYSVKPELQRSATLLLLLLLALFPYSLFAQIPDEATPMRVLRCSALNQNASIKNIFTDDSNVKWVASSSGVFKVFSADNASKEATPPNSWSLLRFRGGNQVIHLDRTKMAELLQGNSPDRPEMDAVTTAFFDKKKKELWVGTSHSGLYQFSARSETKLLNHYTEDNSKLKTNKINTILVDKYGRLWAGTEKGVLYGNDGSMKLYERRDNIIAVTALGPDVWILSDDFLWQVDPNNRWMKGDVDKRFAEGEIRDIEYDSEGRLWVASDIIVRYDVVEDKVERFTKANGFTSSEINVITIDKEDALWVGTEDKGLFLIEKETVMTVSCSIEKGLSCEGNANDATLAVKVIGGTPPLKYKWSSGQTLANPDNLGPGDYTVTVTDSEGKVKVAQAKIDPVKVQAQITVEAPASAFDKEDGRVSIEATGGVPDYKYLWDNGEKSALATKLSPGNHTLTITDKMGCASIINVATPEIEEPVVVEEEPVAEIDTLATVTPSTAAATTTESPKEEVPELILSIESVISLKCSDDVLKKIPLEIKGGKKPYDIKWSDATLSGNQIKAGTYSVTVVDAAKQTKSLKFNVNAPLPIQIAAIEESPVSLKGKRDGQAIASAKGGSGDYLWTWDNGEIQAKAKKLSFGKHTVSLTDSKGCEASTVVQINEKAVPELNASNMRSGQTIQLKKLYFQSDSTNIEAPSIPTLNEVYRFLSSNPKVVVEVGGHTNDIPSHQFCDRLSKARAKAVADYLVTKGIPQARIVFKGYGKRKPIASNRTKQGRAKNQRVELKILSVGD